MNSNRFVQASFSREWKSFFERVRYAWLPYGEIDCRIYAEAWHAAYLVCYLSPNFQIEFNRNANELDTRLIRWLWFLLDDFITFVWHIEMHGGEVVWHWTSNHISCSPTSNRKSERSLAYVIYLSDEIESIYLYIYQSMQHNLDWNFSIRKMGKMIIRMFSLFEVHWLKGSSHVLTCSLQSPQYRTFPNFQLLSRLHIYPKLMWFSCYEYFMFFSLVCSHSCSMFKWVYIKGEILRKTSHFKSSFEQINFWIFRE